MKAILLAAGKGTRLWPITHSIPKCMVPIGDTPMIDRIIDHLTAAGIDELIVVTGYLREVLEGYLRGSSRPLARSARFVYNTRYHDWGNGYSFLTARDAVAGEPFVKLDTDLLLDASILPAVLSTPGQAVLALDKRDTLGIEEMKILLDDNGRVTQVNKHMDPRLAAGECAGIDRFDGELGGLLFDELELMMTAGDTHEFYERAYERLIDKGHELAHADISSANWCEIDSHEDLEMAHQILTLQASGGLSDLPRRSARRAIAG